MDDAFRVSFVQSWADSFKDAGGIFVHHKNARDSLEQLARIYPTVKVPA